MGTSLLAILLVTNSSRGHRLVFYYPKNPQRREQEIRNEDDFEDILVSDVATIPFGSGDDDKRSLKSRIDDEEEKESTTIAPKQGNDDDNCSDITSVEESLFGFETSFLAGILSPNAKSSKKFQLTVDDLTFVGQPVFLTGADSSKDSENEKECIDTISKENENDMNLKQYSRTTESEQQTSDENSEILQSLIPGINNTSLSHSEKHHHHLTLFHLVFVLEPPELELNRQVDNIYKHVITKLTAALRYEQLRSDYVREEAEKILALRDEAANANTSFDELMEKTIKASSLAKTISQVYHSITTDSTAHVLINDYIDLSLQIPPLAPSLFFSPLDTDRDSYEYAHFPVIAPYHTLLLLEDPEEILENIPLDANPTLVQLIQILTPTQRLAELSTLLDCSLAQIYRMTAHLIYWRKAKLIDVINVRNVYVVSPTADLNSLSTLSSDFSHMYPALEHDLAGFLAELSTPRLYAAIIPSKGARTMYLEIITYLLRKDLVVQLHVYFMVMIPQHVKMGLRLEEYEEKMRTGQGGVDNMTASDKNNTALISSSGQATEVEREWLKQKTVNQPKEIVELFERLIKYFNGKHHIEEILFRENISRKDLKIILGLFDELITVFRY